MMGVFPSDWRGRGQGVAGDDAGRPAAADCLVPFVEGHLGRATPVLRVLIDAAVLIVLRKALSDEELEWITAAVIAFVAAVATGLLAFGLGSLLGLIGLVAAVVIVAVGLGAAVSLLFGVEIKRSLLIGAVFVVVDLVVTVGLTLMMG